MHAEYQLGSRMLNGKQVKLSLVAEVCDPGDNPLSTHSKPMPGSGAEFGVRAGVDEASEAGRTVETGESNEIDDEPEQKTQLERPLS